MTVSALSDSFVAPKKKLLVSKYVTKLTKMFEKSKTLQSIIEIKTLLRQQIRNQFSLRVINTNN